MDSSLGIIPATMAKHFEYLATGVGIITASIGSILFLVYGTWAAIWMMVNHPYILCTLAVLVVAYFLGKLYHETRCTIYDELPL